MSMHALFKIIVIKIKTYLEKDSLLCVSQKYNPVYCILAQKHSKIYVENIFFSLKSMKKEKSAATIHDFLVIALKIRYT